MTLRELRAREIVEAIINNLPNRGGLRYRWDDINDEDQAEIMDAWVQIVEKII